MKTQEMTAEELGLKLYERLDYVCDADLTRRDCNFIADFMLKEIASSQQVSREKVVEECKNELLKHLFAMTHSNSYHCYAVPQATILELPALMRLSKLEIGCKTCEGTGNVPCGIKQVISSCPDCKGTGKTATKKETK
jgi:DnaJ-class molecular chaperone